MTSPTFHFVVPGSLDQPTGGYRYAARIVAHLRTLGWAITVHELAGRFPDADRTAEKSLSKTLAALPTDALVTIDGLAMGGLPGPVAAESDRLRMTALVHHPLADETGLPPKGRDRFLMLERNALAACRGIIVTSEFTAARLIEAFQVAPERLRTVIPGTDPAPPAVGPVGGAPPELLCVAAVTPRKGHDVLVRALTRISHLPWHCTCIGSLERSPEHARGVRSLVGEAGLGRRIDFTGSCGDDALEARYQRSSLFVLPSHYEGYGMAFTEALARGLPVIGTTGGATPYTVPADAGRLVPPGDDEALAAALQPLLDSVDGARRRAVLATAALRRARRLPDWSRAAKRFADALLDIVSTDMERRTRERETRD